MTTKPHTWWSVTAFNEEIELLEGQLPEYIRKVYGGREKCPDTGTIHFQGAIQCYDQQRRCKLKTWLKKAHLEPARCKEALKKYAMKEETAIGEKTIRENTTPHYSAHEMCLMLARQTDRQTDGFWTRANKILSKTPELAGQLMNPSLRNFFEKTQKTWMDRVAIVLQQPTIVPERCHCGKDECEVCFEQEMMSLSINATPTCKESVIQAEGASGEAGDGSEATGEEGICT